MTNCPKCGTLLENSDMRSYKWCPKCQNYEKAD